MRLQKWLKYKAKSLENRSTLPYSPNPWAQLTHFFGERALMWLLSDTPKRFFYFVLKAMIWAHLWVFEGSNQGPEIEKKSSLSIVRHSFSLSSLDHHRHQGPSLVMIAIIDHQRHHWSPTSSFINNAIIHHQRHRSSPASWFITSAIIDHKHHHWSTAPSLITSAISLCVLSLIGEKSQITNYTFWSSLRNLVFHSEQNGMTAIIFFFKIWKS